MGRSVGDQLRTIFASDLPGMFRSGVQIQRGISWIQSYDSNASKWSYNLNFIVTTFDDREAQAKLLMHNAQKNQRKST